MASFPTTISCVKTDGFSETLPVTTKYLGSKTFTRKPIVKTTAIITNHADFETFMRWYITDISYGVDSFDITLPFFGVSRAWDVRIVNDISSKLVGKSDSIREIDMQLEIQDDIDTYIST